MVSTSTKRERKINDEGRLFEENWPNFHAFDKIAELQRGVTLKHFLKKIAADQKRAQ